MWSPICQGSQTTNVFGWAERVTFLQLVTLAFVQGVTEFLPVSSSGHLILASKLSNWPDQGLSFDIAAHLGSLLAVCFYFKKDIYSLTRSWFSGSEKNTKEANRDLTLYLIFATVPTIACGFLFYDFITSALRSTYVIGLMTIIFGIALWVADSIGSRKRVLDHMTWRDAVLVGVAQSLALIPGASRSGVTISAALLLGFSREAAVRFSFLLGVPVILAAVIYELSIDSSIPDLESWIALGCMTMFSAIFAYTTIYYFIRFLDRIGMVPFVLYRIIFGASLILFSLNHPQVLAESRTEAFSSSEAAVFAGGCFWCLEEPFDVLDGVQSTIVGYIGGAEENATYQEISKGYTRHVESVKVTYDPKIISFGQLLDVYWRNIDPLDPVGQFCDVGRQYLSVIFFDNQRQELEARRQLRVLQASRFLNRKIVTVISPARPFYSAEDYHQDYYLNNPLRYKLYRYQCSRDSRLREIWEES